MCDSRDKIGGSIEDEGAGTGSDTTDTKRFKGVDSSTKSQINHGPCDKHESVTPRVLVGKLPSWGGFMHGLDELGEQVVE